MGSGTSKSRSSPANGATARAKVILVQKNPLAYSTEITPCDSISDAAAPRSARQRMGNSQSAQASLPQQQREPQAQPQQQDNIQFNPSSAQDQEKKQPMPTDGLSRHSNRQPLAAILQLSSVPPTPRSTQDGYLGANAVGPLAAGLNRNRARAVQAEAAAAAAAAAANNNYGGTGAAASVQGLYAPLTNNLRGGPLAASLEFSPLQANLMANPRASISTPRTMDAGALSPSSRPTTAATTVAGAGGPTQGPYHPLPLSKQRLNQLPLHSPWKASGGGGSVTNSGYGNPGMAAARPAASGGAAPSGGILPDPTAPPPAANERYDAAVHDGDAGGGGGVRLIDCGVDRRPPPTASSLAASEFSTAGYDPYRQSVSGAAPSFTASQGGCWGRFAPHGYPRHHRPQAWPPQAQASRRAPAPTMPQHHYNQQQPVTAAAAYVYNPVPAFAAAQPQPFQPFQPQYPQQQAQQQQPRDILPADRHLRAFPRPDTPPVPLTPSQERLAREQQQQQQMPFYQPQHGFQLQQMGRWQPVAQRVQAPPPPSQVAQQQGGMGGVHGGVFVQQQPQLLVQNGPVGQQLSGSQMPSWMRQQVQQRLSAGGAAADGYPEDNGADGNAGGGGGCMGPIRRSLEKQPSCWPTGRCSPKWQHSPQTSPSRGTSRVASPRPGLTSLRELQPPGTAVSSQVSSPISSRAPSRRSVSQDPYIGGGSCFGAGSEVVDLDPRASDPRVRSARSGRASPSPRDSRSGGIIAAEAGGMFDSSSLASPREGSGCWASPGQQKQAEQKLQQLQQLQLLQQQLHQQQLQQLQQQVQHQQRMLALQEQEQERMLLAHLQEQERRSQQGIATTDRSSPRAASIRTSRSPSPSPRCGAGAVCHVCGADADAASATASASEAPAAPYGPSSAAFSQTQAAAGWPLPAAPPAAGAGGTTSGGGVHAEDSLAWWWERVQGMRERVSAGGGGAATAVGIGGFHSSGGGAYSYAPWLDGEGHGSDGGFSVPSDLSIAAVAEVAVQAVAVAAAAITADAAAGQTAPNATAAVAAQDAAAAVAAVEAALMAPASPRPAEGSAEGLAKEHSAAAVAAAEGAAAAVAAVQAALKGSADDTSAATNDAAVQASPETEGDGEGQANDAPPGVEAAAEAAAGEDGGKRDAAVGTEPLEEPEPAEAEAEAAAEGVEVAEVEAESGNT